MAKLNQERARALLAQHVDPSEQLLQVGFGVEPLNPLVFIFLTVVTVGVALPLAVQLLRKQYVVGVTSSRLLLLRLRGLTFAPVGCTGCALNLLKGVRVSAGPVFVRVEFEQGGTRHTLKFHRGAFSGNREGALGIGKALEEGGLAPAPTGLSVSSQGHDADARTRGASWHVGLAMAGLSLLVGVGLAVASGWAMAWTQLILGAVVAGFIAAIVASLGIPQQSSIRGAVAGAFGGVGERVVGGITYFAVSTGGDLSAAVQWTLSMLSHPSPTLLVVLAVYASAGAAVVSWSERRTGTRT